MIRSKKITQSAKGEECTMNSPVCNYNPETTVWCHSNYYEDDKGKGLKAHDIFGFYGCYACHDWFDNSTKHLKGEKYSYFHRAMKRSWLRLIEKGVITIK
jgi:hypothetical protein